MRKEDGQVCRDQESAEAEKVLTLFYINLLLLKNAAKIKENKPLHDHFSAMIVQGFVFFHFSCIFKEQ